MTEEKKIAIKTHQYFDTIRNNSLGIPYPEFLGLEMFRISDFVFLSEFVNFHIHSEIMLRWDPI